MVNFGTLYIRDIFFVRHPIKWFATIIRALSKVKKKKGSCQKLLGMELSLDVTKPGAPEPNTMP